MSLNRSIFWYRWLYYSLRNHLALCVWEAIYVLDIVALCVWEATYILRDRRDRSNHVLDSSSAASLVLTSKRGMVLFSYYIAYGYVCTYVNSKFGHDPLNGRRIQNIMSGKRVARKLVTAKFRPLTTTRRSELICFNGFGGGYHRERLAIYYGCHLDVAFIRLKAILLDGLNIPVGLL